MQDRRISCGDQSYPAGDPSTAPVGAFTQKLSARLQASGEAQFSSDLHPNNLVYGQFVVVADNGNEDTHGADCTNGLLPLPYTAVQ